MPVQFGYARKLLLESRFATQLVNSVLLQIRHATDRPLYLLERVIKGLGKLVVLADYLINTCDDIFYADCLVYCPNPS